MSWSKVFSNPSLIWTPRGDDGFRSNVVEYGLRDDKGRSIGGYAVISIGYPNPGVWLRTQATRNGKTYGAITNRTECSSLEQAKALAEKKLQAAAKRYAKQFGP